MNKFRNSLIAPELGTQARVKYSVIGTLHPIVLTGQEVKEEPVPIDKDHCYFKNRDRLPKEKQDCYLSIPKKRKIENANKIAVDITVNSIIKEEIMIPDDHETHVDQEVLMDISLKQIDTIQSDEKRKEAFVSKIKDKIFALSKMKSSNEVEIISVKDSASDSLCNNLKPQIAINNSDTSHNLGNERRKVSGAAKSILKISNFTDNGTTITISDVPKITNLKPSSQSHSVLKSVASKQTPLVAQSPITDAAQAENRVHQVEKDKSTIHLLNMKEKQIVITNNSFTEIKKEVVEADLDEQVADRNKRFYHAICLSCKKLKLLNNQNNKCNVCQSIFQYECMRCRDILSCKEEYYNHLKKGEYCLEIQIPAFLRNDSYALATRLEKNQCTEAVWERTEKLVTIVREARAKLKGKFNRIKSCCPVCDKTHHVDNGKFWCMQCSMSSVFKCQTCNRSYTTYCSAIHHEESRMVKKPVFECNECPFKHRRKQMLQVHILDKHAIVSKEPEIKKKKSKAVQCPHCNLVIRSNAYWRKHTYSCPGRVYFRCKLCREKYLAKGEMTSHLLVAHQMINSQIVEMIKEIEEDRNNQEIKKTRRKQPGVRKRKKNRKFCRSHHITPYCIRCNTIYEDLSVTHSNNCTKCESYIRVQCNYCKRTFRSYKTAYQHIKTKCERIGAVSMEKNNQIIGYKKSGKVKKKPQEECNIQFSHSILKNRVFVNNGKKFDNISILEANQLVENVDVKVEYQDIKVFDGLINFDNYEVIIPDIEVEHNN